MITEERILEPKYYCPKCGRLMNVMAFDDDEEPMNIVEAKCPLEHRYVLRIKKNATDKEMVDQMAYIIESEGGEVIYED